MGLMGTVPSWTHTVETLWCTGFSKRCAGCYIQSTGCSKRLTQWIHTMPFKVLVIKVTLFICLDMPSHKKYIYAFYSQFTHEIYRTFTTPCHNVHDAHDLLSRFTGCTGCFARCTQRLNIVHKVHNITSIWKENLKTLWPFIDMS